MKIFKRLFCKHENESHGWSYIKCKKCDRVKYNPEKNRILLSEKLEKLNYSDTDKAKFMNRSLMFQ